MGPVLAKGHPAWKRRTTAFFVIVGLALILVFALKPQQTTGSGVAVGAPPPDFALKTMDGKSLSLSQLKGKVVLVNFWASWCPPCRDETPNLVQVYDRFHQQGVEFVAVNLQENTVTVRAFADRYHITYPIVLDTYGRVTDQFHVTPLPTTYLIGKDGKVAAKLEQPLSQGVMEGYLTSLLAK